MRISIHFCINQGISVIFQFLFLQNFSKMNKHTPSFITEGLQPSQNIRFFHHSDISLGFFGLDALKYCYYQCHMLKTSYLFGFWWKTATPKIGIPRLTYLKTFKMSLYTLNEKTQSRGLFYIKSNAWKYIWMMKKNP